MPPRRAFAFVFAAFVATFSPSCRQPDGGDVSEEAVRRRAEWTDPSRLSKAAAAAPDPKSVLAVLFDEPLAGSYSTLAVFADGGAKLLTSNGAGLFLETAELPEGVRKAAAALCAAATPLRSKFFEGGGDWPRRGRVRVTLVTRDGLFSREEMQNAMLDKSSDLAPLTDGFLAAMKQLLEINRVEARRVK
jgi:hypothetical protein